MKTRNRVREIPRRRPQILIILIAFSAWTTAVAEFRITSVTIGVDGVIRLGYPAQADSYYTLLKGGLAGSEKSVAIALGVVGEGALLDPIAVQESSAQFYRILQRPIAQPLDVDEDGLSDVAELAQTRTDPINSDTDDDGWLDGDEFDSASDPLNGLSRPALTVSATAEIEILPSLTVLAEGGLEIAVLTYGGESLVLANPVVELLFSDPLIEGEPAVGPHFSRAQPLIEVNPSRPNSP